LAPLAGLEPATCCLGDVSAWALCPSAKFLVASDRKAKVIRWCWRLVSYSANGAYGTAWTGSDH
jgi:hypothetical protein